MPNSEQIAENMLTAMQIIAEAQPNDKDITIDAFIIDATRAKEGVYTVGSGYSQFTAYSQATYKENENVYVLIPGGDYNKSKLIIGRRVSDSNGVYNVIDELEDMVFFHGSDASLINFDGKSIGIQANNRLEQEVLIGTWEGTYAGVSRLGLAPTFTSYLKPLGIVEGNYGIRLVVTDNGGATEEIKFDSDEYFGNPYNYIYSTRLSRVHYFSTVKTIKRIEAYLYQKNNFVDENDNRVLPTDTNKNIFLNKIFVGVGVGKNEIMTSRCSISTASGSNTYYSEEYAATLSPNPAIEVRFAEALDELLKQLEESEYSEKNVKDIWNSISSNFSLVELTRINKWLENYKFFENIENYNSYDSCKNYLQYTKQDAASSILAELSCYRPYLIYSLAIKDGENMNYISDIPSYDISTAAGQAARVNFIKWFRAKKDSVITSNTLPAELLTGWEIIGSLDTGDNPTSEILPTGCLLFTPDYTENTQIVRALVTYKNKQYLSDTLTLSNLRNAEKEIAEEEQQKKLDDQEAQRLSDLDLISANQKALNDIYLECGYYDDNNKFVPNQGAFSYYTRSGAIKEGWKDKQFAVRCYSLAPGRTALPTYLGSTGFFRCKDAGKSSSMIFSQEEPTYKTFETSNGATEGYEILFTPYRYYEPTRAANTFIFSAECEITGDLSVTEQQLENSLTLTFGYHDCLGTEYSVTAHWTNTNGEIVHSLVPGRTYTPHLLVDGKEVAVSWECMGSKSGSLTSTYTPELEDICFVKGVVEMSAELKLACYLPAIISYNEDNIIEGPTEVMYQTDGLPHLRTVGKTDDIGPIYKLELLIENNSGNQKYVTEVNWSDIVSASTLDHLELAYGYTDRDDWSWSFDSDGKSIASGPSNWSIQAAGSNTPIYLRKQDATGDLTQEVSVNYEDFGTLTVVSKKADGEENNYSRVEYTPMSYFVSDNENRIFGVRVYTAYGYLLATIPVVYRINRYASAYIDKMAEFTGTVKIDEEKAVIYSPRILAGKYTSVSEGAPVFTGVALGDYADEDTESSMQLTGLYGFSKGTQVYAFKEDGTGFIGSNEGRINFDGNSATIKNSGYDNISGSGMLIDINDANIFCHRGTNEAYFGAGDTNMPLKINDNFSVDWNGNAYIGGRGSINISNGQSRFYVNSSGISMTGDIQILNESNQAGMIIGSNGIQLKGSITGLSYNSLTDKPDLDSLAMSPEDIAQAVANQSDGLFLYENGALGIRASAISADYIGTGTMNVGFGGIAMNGYLTVKGTVWGVAKDLPVGTIGYGQGSLPNGSNTYGIKMSVGDANYFIITNAGARLEIGKTADDNYPVTFGFYNGGLTITAWEDMKSNKAVGRKTYGWS